MTKPSISEPSKYNPAMEEDRVHGKGKGFRANPCEQKNKVPRVYLRILLLCEGFHD